MSRMLFALALVLVPLASAHAGSPCTDQAAVAATRAAANVQCTCASATDQGAYVKCVASVADAAVAANTLPKECKGAVTRCAAKSTCAKPGFVTCCRTTSKGATTCAIKSSAATCKPPKGGQACVGTFSSCCDACVTGGCAKITCAPNAAHCGDGVSQPQCGEQCDGADPGICPGFGCGAPDGPLACQCCVEGGAMTGSNPLPCCSGCGNCEPWAPHQCICRFKMVGGSCCVGLNQACIAPPLLGPAPCCPGLECQKPVGFSGEVVCCAPTGQPCSQGADCCGNSCNAGTATCN